MKRTIAIVAGGDTSEFHVSLRSAQGIYSFIDKEKYTLYIVEMHGLDWHVQLPDGAKTPVDRNDFSFVLDGEKVTFDFAYITIHGTPGENGILQGYFDLLDTVLTRSAVNGDISEIEKLLFAILHESEVVTVDGSFSAVGQYDFPTVPFHLYYI